MVYAWIYIIIQCYSLNMSNNVVIKQNEKRIQEKEGREKSKLERKGNLPFKKYRRVVREI